MAFSLGVSIEQIAVGWLVFESTGSVFLTALAWSVRSLPNLLFGGLAGVIADRYPRNRILAINAAVRIIALLGMAFTTTYLDASVVILLCLVALSGMTQTTQLASIQSLATAVVPVDKLSTAVSFMAFAQRSVSIIGALLSGYMLFKAGSASVFLVATIPLAAACGFFATVPSTPVSHVQGASFWAALQTGAGELARVPAVVQLLALMALAEIF
ncbi:MAG: MFS transporter, partial [Gammaproteobacteria bacterium]|nr:MFS transporter [Gammaproteobacteria bacterium]